MGASETSWQLIPLSLLAAQIGIALFVSPVIATSRSLPNGGQFAAVTDTAKNGGSNEAGPAASTRARAWADAALDYLRTLNCEETVLASPRECQYLRTVQRRDVAVYTAEAERTGERLYIILPDETLSGGRAWHDAVLTLDPHPDADFGHLIVVFYVDRCTDCEVSCRRAGKIYDGHGHCLTLALKNRCRNAIDSRIRGGGGAAAVSDYIAASAPAGLAALPSIDAGGSGSRRVRKYSKRCEINFLPLVYQASSSSSSGAVSPSPAAPSGSEPAALDRAAVAPAGGQHTGENERSSAGREEAILAAASAQQTTAAQQPVAPAARTTVKPLLRQMLVCRDDLPEYARCPQLRPQQLHERAVAERPACDPIRDNTRRCETSHDLVRTRCRLYESCDQAVLVSGGWNRQHALQRQWDGLVAAYRMLRRNGFHRDTIKVFYADGASDGIPGEEQEESGEVLPASSKPALRSHIKKMCESPHCVDTLVLYLNSPAKSDGSILLWDANGDGLAEQGERYLVDEMASDLAGCLARHVLIIADQSYSGELAKVFRRSPRDHGNVLVYASGREHEYAYGNEFTLRWTSFDHDHACASDVFQRIKASMVHSNPEVGEANRGGGGSRITIFGAPCDVDPPFTPRELRVYYRGCQNVPTEVWWRRWYFQMSSQQQHQQLLQQQQNEQYRQQQQNVHTAAGDQAVGDELLSVPVYRPESLPGSDMK